MTEFDLFDSIGNVDDELIEKAVKPKMNSTNMRLFLITGSIAACAVIAVTVVFLTSGNNTTLEKSFTLRISHFKLIKITIPIVFIIVVMILNATAI